MPYKHAYSLFSLHERGKKECACQNTHFGPLQSCVSLCLYVLVSSPILIPSLHSSFTLLYLSRTHSHSLTHTHTYLAASRGDMDPVLTHADALDHLVSRVISWVTAAEGLRNNIKAVAEIEKQSAARIRKLTVVPAYFLQAPQSQDNDKPTQDSVISALRGCFEFVPANMAAFHEEIASNLIQLDTKQGKELEKLAQKHKAAIEAVVFTVYGRVERAREDLEAKARKLHSLMHSDDDHAEVWLAQVQQAAARRQVLSLLALLVQKCKY
jgi:hypothetical protein